MRNLVLNALIELARRRPIFHSEADFQHELAVQISRTDSEVEIRLERPVRAPGTHTVNVDILLRRDSQNYALELKYITARTEITVAGEVFNLRAQSAQDLRRYDIWKDLMRIESLISAGAVRAGMSITITNDRSLWSEPRAASTVDQAFRLHQGRTVTGNLGWAAHAAVGTTRGREAPLILENTYALDWSEYSHFTDAPNGQFRMLIVQAGT